MVALVKKIQNDISEYAFLKKDRRFVLGVSGGPDSSVMLDVFLKLKQKYSLELIIVHINYNLRGEDSKKDEKFVRELAQKNGLPIIVFAPKIRKKAISEEKLRGIRYAFFEEVRTKQNFDFISVAHTLDDQAETVLMRVIRGSGLKGLRAMQIKNGKIIRPLLNTSRQEVLKYIKENKLKYRIDKSNSERLFFRNKIRNDLIPQLEKKYNPQIKRRLANMAKTFTEDFSAIEYFVDDLWKKEAVWGVKKILNLPPAVQKRILEKILLKKNPEIRLADFSQIDSFLKALRSVKGKKQSVLCVNLKMIRKGDKIDVCFVE
jgi:tRNA(Ile)-lysidine synthase